MSHRHRDQRGETLAEICLTIVLMGAIVSAFFAAYSTSVDASTNHRDLVTADAVLRDYAEATKNAVRTDCTSAGATYDVTSYTPPSGFSVSNDGDGICPATTSTETIGLTATMPNGTTKTLSIAVRTP